MRAIQFLPVLTLTIVLLGSAIFSAQAMESKSPKLYAVNFYADWCGKCKILDPEFMKAVKDGGWSEDQIKVVKLDLTDKVRIGKAVEHSKEMGLYHILKANGAKTGSIALVDGSSKQEIKRYFAGVKAADVQAEIAQTLAE